MDPFTIIIGAIIFIMLLKLSGKSRQARILDPIPGPDGYPIVGNAFDFIGAREKRLAVIRKWDAKFGPIYKTWLGSKAFVHIMKPEYIEVILSSTKHIQKGAIYRFVTPWLGTGLLTSKGAKWHKHRKMITPTFHFKILESFIEVFNDNCLILLEKLKLKSESQEVFDIHPYITLCALDIINETAMGTKINAQEQEHSPYVKSLYELSRLTMARFNKVWLHSDFIFRHSSLGKEFYGHLKVLHDFTSGVVKERKEKRKQNGTTTEQQDGTGVKQRKAFLDLLLDVSENEESGNRLTSEELREEVDTFMFEGHDTTTAGISWALFLLGNHSAVQEKAAEELDKIFQDDPDRLATIADLSEMKYLERVIKETLRIRPVVPFISRKIEEDVKIDEYLIPRDTTISLSIWSLHRDPRYFPDPEKFNPDNFLPERVQTRHPYAFIPFSAGPRNCIGQKFAMLEEKVILSSILRKFKIEAVEKMEDMTIISEIILKSKSGIKVRLAPRKRTVK